MPDGYLNTPANSPGLFAGLLPENQLAQMKVTQAGAFSNGLPKDANGNVDWNAASQTAFKVGAFDLGNSLMQTGISQQMLRAAQAPSAVLGGGGGQPAAAPSSSTSSYTKPSPGFDSAVDRSLGFEGGLNKSDTNGTPSNYGINEAAHPEVDVTKLTPDDAKAIYRRDYWDAIDGDNLSPGLSRAAFDTAVIAGPAKAKELLAQSGGDPMKYMTLRDQYLQGLIQADPAKFGKYQNAWNARNNGLRYDILGLNAQSGQQGIGGGQQTSGASSGAAPLQIVRNGADDSDPDAPAPSSQHPYAPNRPPVQKPGVGTSPQPMPVAGGQPGPGLTPIGLNSPTPGGAQSPSPVDANPPTRWASNGTNFVDPTLGGLVTPQQLQQYGSYGGIAKALVQEANSLSGNQFAKTRIDDNILLAKQIMGAVAKAQEMTPEQKNARDPSVLGFESQRDANKAQSRVDAQNSPVAVTGAAAKAEAGEEGKYLGQLPGKLATAADNGKLQSNLVDEMLDAGNQFRMGPGASTQQNFNAKLSALGDAMGVDTSSIKGQVAGYTDFNKLAGQLTRQSIKDTGSSRAGIQEMQMVSSSLPSPDMSQDGFRSVANQIKGLNDFSAAKQQAGQAWLDQRHTMAGFETSWNKNVTPAAFVLHRLQQDQPDLFASTVQRMAQTPQGRGVLSNVKSGLAWGGQNGLF